MRKHLTSEDIAIEHAPASTANLRRAADDSTQKAIWIGFYVMMGVLLVVGVAVGLTHENGAGEALPPPPAAAH